MREVLAKAGDDEDTVRGICRIFAEAGETYHTLILRHQEEFFPLVETLIECAAYHELEIVQISFRFWYLLASALGKKRSDPSITPFLQIYARLLDIIIGHLRFPDDDDDSKTATEMDDFRNFRHYMGDTLKDCCYVLGSKECLTRSLHMIQDAVSSAQSAGHEARWQDVEAPLFSMRAMGAEVNVENHDEVVGQIINAIPTLPNHPRMRYAGLLVISRYTDWLNAHPDRIPDLLGYISAGLETEGEVSAAAGQAMNYLCQDCSRHLVPYLPQLFAFLSSVNDRLEPDDLITMGDAIGNIVTRMPPNEAAGAMMQFAQPILQLLAEVGASDGASKDDLKRANIRIDMLERFLYTIDDCFAQSLPSECSKTVTEAYAVIDNLLHKYGSAYWLHQSSVNLLRRGMIFFGPLAQPVLPDLLDRMSSLFAATGFSGYLWISGRVIDAYSSSCGGDARFRAAVQSSFEKSSTKVMQVLENSMPREIPDIIEDYVDVSSALLAELPDQLILTPIFPHAFRTAVTALTLVQDQIVARALEFLRRIVGHDALSVAPTASQPGTPLNLGMNGSSNGNSAEQLTAFAASIRGVLASQGFPLISVLLEGLVTTFSPDQNQTVALIFKVLVSGFPRECLAWIGPAVESLPNAAISHVEKAKFLERFMTSVERSDLIGVKNALLDGLYRASRKSRERGRVDRVDSQFEGVNGGGDVGR